MDYPVEKSYGAWIGILLGIFIFGFTFWGIDYSLGPSQQTLRTALLIPAYVFLAVYIILIVGALSMGYRTESNHLAIKWGLRTIRVPWSDINEIIKVTGKSNLFSILGASWPGYMIGLYSIKGLGPARMYATHPQKGFIYLKTERGFFGITPQDQTLIGEIAQRSGKEITIVNMDQVPVEVKGKSMQEDNFYRLLFWLNLIFIAVFTVYLGLFYPGSGAPRLVILLLVLAIALFFFNIGNAGRLYQFSSQGGYILLLVGIAVTGIFLILSLSEISL
ncbi:PH domain-containing protein [Syntrophomonas erecta]